MSDLFKELHRIILCSDPSEKCAATRALSSSINNYHFMHDGPISEILSPGYPSNLKLVPPRELKRRGMQSQEGRFNG